MKLLFIQHVSFETPGYLLSWAEKRNIPYSICLPEKENFPAPDSFDLLVIMGGPMGVYEEEKYKWLASEKEFIRRAIDAGKKILGICLGAQLLAEALGAKVYPHDQKEIGWWPIQTAPGISSRLLPGFPDSWTSFHWHGDTFDLPQGSVRLFSSNACREQGFLAASQFMGIQFHPEVTKKEVQAMVMHGKQELVAGAWIHPAEKILSEEDPYAENHRLLDAMMKTLTAE